MKKIINYQFKANAYFAQLELEKKQIEVDIKQDNEGYSLWGDEKIYEQAKQEVEQLALDESEVDPDSKGYVEGHLEWTQKMYDPGHYTGGKIPHFYLDKSNFLTMSIYFMGWGLIIFLMEKNHYHSYGDFIAPFIYLLIGISLRVQYRKKYKKKMQENKNSIV